MTTFSLVHGAFGDASIWDLLRPELEARGHEVVAMDLPCSDPTAGAARYAEVVDASLGGRSSGVIVVGHSLGGLTIPLVAARRPIERLVFLCAFIPQPGRAFREQFAEEEGMFPPSSESTWPVPRDDGLMTWPAERAIPALFGDLPLDLAVRVAKKLRPQSTAPHAEVCPLLEWPAVPSSYVLATEDTQVGADWARGAAQERLGTTAIELPGGHCPMLGRPAELAEVLHGLTR